MGLLQSLIAPSNTLDHADFEFGPDWRNAISDSGVVVNAETAMRFVTVYACVTLIADAVRALPVDVVRKSGEVREPVSRPPMWLSMPNPRQTWGQFIDHTLHSLLIHGNAFVWLPTRDSLGFPDTLEVLHPDNVQVNASNGQKKIIVSGDRIPEFNIRNQSGRILHILGHTADGVVGLSPVEQAKQAIGSGLAKEEFGNRLWSNGAVTSGAIEMPAGSNPNPDQLKSLKTEFERNHAGLENAWRPMVLANGAQWKPMSVPNEQAQFIESVRLSVAEIARLYRVPPHLIGDVERSTSWGSGIEQQNIGFVQHTLTPWLTRLEESFGQLLPRGQQLKFNVNALLRGDMAARAAFNEAMARMKAKTINEIRADEDLPPFDDGDQPPPAPNESI